MTQINARQGDFHWEQEERSTTPRSQGRGWHSRGYLPHFDVAGLVQGLTFRLHDSVPEAVVLRWKEELEWKATLSAADARCVALRKHIAAYEDAGHGECWLRRSAIAHLVQEALLFFNGGRYRLLAWCIMPNHVHALIETLPAHPVGEVVQSWKRHTAREANRLLQRTAQPFWLQDYHDRFIRDARHHAAAVAYIHDNPVSAGLVSQPGEWRWSSAHPGSADLQSAFPP